MHKRCKPDSNRRLCLHRFKKKNSAWAALRRGRNDTETAPDRVQAFLLARDRASTSKELLHSSRISLTPSRVVWQSLSSKPTTTKFHVKSNPLEAFRPTPVRCNNTKWCGETFIRVKRENFIVPQARRDHEPWHDATLCGGAFFRGGWNEQKSIRKFNETHARIGIALRAKSSTRSSLIRFDSMKNCILWVPWTVLRET